ncbi:MAG: GNAT family N-acetyltransferase [Thermoplasmata archaeon]|nr:GNAT family N-acetyltransferase [Thermoplasmata archaeon]
MPAPRTPRRRRVEPPTRRSKSGAPFTLRRAESKDESTLIEHRLAMWRDIGSYPEKAVAGHARPYRRWLRRMMKRGELVAYVLESRDGAIAASGAVQFVLDHPRPGHTDRNGYLLSMYTDPAYRHRGLASQIVRAAIRECRRRGLSRITLHASPFGRSVYRALGFERSWEMRRLLRDPRRRAARRR